MGEKSHGWSPQILYISAGRPDTKHLQASLANCDCGEAREALPHPRRLTQSPN